MTVHTTDVAIIGAGPVGLFAIFECGMMNMRCHVVDALSEIGGQCVALYPEKPIYDIPAWPSILAKDLIARLEEQSAPFHPTYHLGQSVVKLAATDDVEAETDEAFAVRMAQYEADKTAFDAALEAARQKVDRIAFAGQVPVNVTGASAGQYIIPINDNGAIKGEAVSNPTFEQYKISVGKVIAIDVDGRAKIIVKVV